MQPFRVIRAIGSRSNLMKRFVFAAAAVAATLAVLPASAQYSGGGSYGGSYGEGGYGGRSYEDDDDYPRRRRPPSPPYGGPRGQGPYGPPGNAYGQQGYGQSAQRLGSICVTARGNCPWRPSPINAPCGCDISGFGFKRGAVGGSFAY